MKYKQHKQYRLPGFNYADDGDYFVTINTQHRNKEYFGKIKNDKMVLSSLGKIVDMIWNKIPLKFPDVLLDTYQIMPEHFHGIIKIQRDIIIKDRSIFKSGIINNPMELKEKSLGYIIRWFKSKVKFESDKIEPGFKWQSRFYDRIIRDEKEFYFIKNYIENNPKNYIKDKDDRNLMEYFNSRKNL